MKATKIVKGHKALGYNRVIFNVNNELFVGTLQGIDKGICFIGSKSFPETLELKSFEMESDFNSELSSLKRNSVIILDSKSKFQSEMEIISEMQNNYFWDKKISGKKIN